MVYIDYPVFKIKVGFSQSAEFGNPKPRPQQYDITYTEFKALPESLQKDYVQNIIDKYGVGPSALAELMGANAGAVGVYLSKRGFSFKRGFQPKKEDLERFREDYGISAKAPTKK